MITVLTGQNSVLLERKLAEYIAEAQSQPEHLDSETVTHETLSDLAHGLSLFTSHRLVVLRRLSDETNTWKDMADWVEALQASDTHLILVEPAPDKRTKTYKELAKHATMHTFEALDERQVAQAHRFAEDEAQYWGATITKPQLRKVVDRVGIDAVQISQAIERLSLFEAIDDALIEEVVEENPKENIFRLFDTALSGDTARVHEMIQVLRTSEEPHRTFGLLAHQVEVLVALALAPQKPAQQVAKDLGVHPYGAQQLTHRARQMDFRAVEQLIAQFRATDQQIKSSSGNEWTMIETLLIQVGQD